MLTKDLAFGLSSNRVVRWNQIEVGKEFDLEEGRQSTAFVHFLKTKNPGVILARFCC